MISVWDSPYTCIRQPIPVLASLYVYGQPIHVQVHTHNSNTVWRKCLMVQNFDEWSSQGF